MQGTVPGQIGDVTPELPEVLNRDGPISPTYEELSLMTRQEWDNTTYHQNHRQALMGKPPGAALPWSFIPMAHLACHRRPALAGRSLRVADELVIHDNLRKLATIISDTASKSRASWDLGPPRLTLLSIL